HHPRASALEVVLQRLESLLVDRQHHVGHGVVGVDGPRDRRAVAVGPHGDGRLVLLDRDTVDDAVHDLTVGVVLAHEVFGDLHAHHGEMAVVAFDATGIDARQPLAQPPEVTDDGPYLVR